MISFAFDVFFFWVSAHFNDSGRKCVMSTYALETRPLGSHSPTAGVSWSSHLTLFQVLIHKIGMIQYYLFV